MRQKHFILMIVTAMMLSGAVPATAAERGGPPERHEKPRFNSLAQINLSAEQTKTIKNLRTALEKTMAPLMLQEHQAKEALDIFWLQLTPDVEKIKSAQKKIHDIRFQILEQETDFRIAMRKVLTRDQLYRFLAMGGSRSQGPDKFDHRPPHPLQPERY